MRLSNSQISFNNKITIIAYYFFTTKGLCLAYCTFARKIYTPCPLPLVLHTLHIFSFVALRC